MSKYKVRIKDIVPLVEEFEIVTVKDEVISPYDMEEKIREVILDYIGYSISIEEVETDGRKG